MAEDILAPGLPIIDPHHHLWDFQPLLGIIPETAHPFGAIVQTSPRYLLDELLADTCNGHNILGTVFVECGAFYRAGGPACLKPVGEVEFVNGIAAQSASGIYGPLRACAGIVGHADLRHGSRVAAMLEAEIAAGNGRFRGIRHIGANNPDPLVLGPLAHALPGLYGDASFREGFAHLSQLALSFDAWVLEPQICEVTDLARAFPDTTIVLDHVGTPLGLSSYTGRQGERFGLWRDAIRDLASCPNVMVKLGGLAMPFCAFPGLGPTTRPTSAALADMWRPYIETCIEAFGPARSMFESNYPVDKWGVDYAVLWNAFKRLAAGASAEERHNLFAGSAARFYRLEELTI